ncbi:MAG: hypothetical protein RLZZ151_32 [Pseudomonadota bacterium]|jgi:hypothetical protein
MIIEEGYLRGSIDGFNNQNTMFTFIGGGTWIQSEYKYVYQYQYQPYAKVIEIKGQPYIQIDGIDDCVLVRKVK